MGGTACGTASHEPGLVGLVIISSPFNIESSLKLTSDDFDLTYPKLFVGSKMDQPYTSAVRKMGDWSPDLKEIKIFSGSAHGTDLFDTEHADEFRELLLSLMEGVR